MKKQTKRTLLVSAVLLFFAAGVSAQANTKRASSRERSVATAVVTAPIKVAAVIVGSAGKSVWVTTKFVGQNVAGPVAKTLFLTAAPRLAVFAVKQTAKRALPLAVKLSLL